MMLSQIYADYLNAQKEEKERDPFRLFASDVGTCHRKIAYRMLQTEKNITLDQTTINKTIMFDLAEHVESVLADALKSTGDLIDYQTELPFEQEGWWNWGGRADILADYDGERRVIEVKTVRSSAFNYGVGHPWYHMQAKVYDILLRKPFELTGPPIVAIFDRGGTNTPVEQFTTLSDEEVLDEMMELESMRKAVMEDGTLPPRLSRVLKERAYRKKIVQEADGSCSYCDYSYVCCPDTSTSVWARRANKGDHYIPTKKADFARLIPFMDELIEKALYEQED